MEDDARLTRDKIEVMSLEDAATLVDNKTYAGCELIERLELAGKLHGNGHHMRQKVAKFAADLVRERWNGT